MSKIFADLNLEQETAVLHTDGPLRILAGAGSGKTKVLTHKIAYLISTIGIAPKKILAVTFTNKAANEMRARVASIIGEKEAKKSQISTYHALAVKILRREIDFFGYPRNFTIIDNIDQQQIFKPIYAKLGINIRTLSYSSMIDYISYCKNMELTAEDAVENATKDGEKIKAEIYKQYMIKQKEVFALDFDDLLLFVNVLFNRSSEAKKRWKNKYDYVLVDEFQDTSRVQYEIVKTLAHHENMTIVGDPDQTIYTWRGADISLILDFDKDFANVSTIKLEQNYRSTKKILQAANRLIEFNANRLDKVLFSENEEGDDILFYHGHSPESESRWIVNKINALKKQKVQLKNIAIFYRAAYLSKNVEQALIKEGIPYRVLGSIKFFQRQEIKDAIAFLKVINNGDPVAFRRIINVPSRKIGAMAIEKLNNFVTEKKETFFAGVINNFSELPLTRVQKINLANLINLINKYRVALRTNSIALTIEKFLVEAKYYSALDEFNDEARKINVKELIMGIETWEKQNSSKNLDDYLQEVALYAAQDSSELNNNTVSLMTIHSSKGLEFDNVFVVGTSEKIFPSGKTMDENGQEGLEEERRLAYVAITRARKKLFFTDSKGYSIDHKFQKKPSRFLSEMGLNIKDFTKEFIPPVNPHDNYVDKREWIAGDFVMHIIFGKGEIVKVSGEIIEVAFGEPHGVKTLMKNHKSLELF